MGDNPVIPDSGTPTFTVDVTAQADQDPGLPISQRILRSISRFDQHAKKIMQSLRVAIPAIVEDFQPGPPATVSVQIAIKEPVQMNLNGPAGPPIDVKVVKLVPGLIIESIPVVLPSGGGWSLTLPIVKGDECLLVFADACIDSWWQSGGVQAPISFRRHSLSDAMAIFGLRSTPTGITGWSTDSAQLRNDDQSVVIDLGNSGDVSITASGAINIKASGNLSVEGETVAIKSTGGQTTIDGKPFLPHAHSGVQSGGSTTGPVV
jgi:hypothetical protein